MKPIVIEPAKRVGDAGTDSHRWLAHLQLVTIAEDSDPIFNPG